MSAIADGRLESLSIMLARESAYLAGRSETSLSMTDEIRSRCRQQMVAPTLRSRSAAPPSTRAPRSRGNISGCGRRDKLTVSIDYGGDLSHEHSERTITRLLDALAVLALNWRDNDGNAGYKQQTWCAAPRCLDHMIVFGEAHLRRIVGAYAAYYNESRTHRSLNKDAPFHRAIERLGAIKSQPVLGGLHHQYCRI